MFMWIITKDHTFDADYDDENSAGKGRISSRLKIQLETYEQRIAWAEKNLPCQWRCYDDDGDLYFEGRSSERDTEEAFMPLDWAINDAGCARIDYLQDDGKWETL